MEVLDILVSRWAIMISINQKEKKKQKAYENIRETELSRTGLLYFIYTFVHLYIYD